VSGGSGLRGDLHERPDGGFDGWCWDPDRPQQRLMVDLLVNDRVAASMVAGVFRRDVLALGCGDGRHGFALRLPPHLLPAEEECLISARERASGTMFGRLLRAAPTLAPPGLDRAMAVAADVGALWETLEECARRLGEPSASARVRVAFDGLARRCGARARGILASGAALPVPAAPALSLLLRAGTAAATRQRIAALTPALEAASVELLLLDQQADPEAALLPAAFRNLPYLRIRPGASPAECLRLAAAARRGRMLALLGAPPAQPSAAALLALARMAAAAPDTLLLGATAAEVAGAVAPCAEPPLRLPAALGLLIGGPRALWQRLGATPDALGADATLAAADLALRARLLGHEWRCVEEPPAAETAAPPPIARRHAARALQARWSVAA